MGELVIKVKDKDEFEPYYIGDYLIQEPLTSDNSGFSKWGFCYKEDKKYFIKQFLSPVYPSDDVALAEDLRQRKIDQCYEWFYAKKKIYDRIVDAQNGNIIAPAVFFHHDTHFYLVTEAVPKSALSFDVMPKVNFIQKQTILKVLSDSFIRLAERGIIHADLKLSNLMLKPTVGEFFTIKIIDFDASYLQEAPPEPDDIQGDPVYLAPESFLAMLEEDDVKLTPKVDVFAMGVVFHQLLSGEMPEFPEEYNYLYEAVLDEAEIKLNVNLLPVHRQIIERMLKRDPMERYSMQQVYEDLCAYEERKKNAAEERDRELAEKKKKAAPVKAPEPKKEAKKWRAMDDFD